jgi:cytochrome c peroxidase
MKHSRIPIAALIVSGFFLNGCGGKVTDSGGGPTPVTIEVPDFPPLESPAGNPLTEEGIALGRRLFHDPILSGDSTQACADCHAQAFAFTDHGEQFSTGIDGTAGTRNAPAVINPGWLPALFWDGRAASLEEQALEPVPNVIEMHEDWDTAVMKLSRHPDYPARFEAAFGGGPITRERVVMAIAQFERTFISENSRFDRYKRHEIELTQEEKDGFLIFFSEQGDCFHCHDYPLMTDNRFHNTGLDSTFTDLGLEEFTGRPQDRGKFKTPTLRNVEHTAPYMHDGRFQTLEEVVRHYNRGGTFSPTVDPLMRTGSGLRLTDEQVAHVVAFLRTLSDPDFINNPDFAPPSP